MITTPICPNCGCSLVRLGISNDQAVPHSYDGKQYRFCCQGCVDAFKTDPQKYLHETNDLIVCPTCLVEKPLQQAVTLRVAGQEVQFCRCPYCAELFQTEPDFYIQRLEGTIPNAGVFDHEGCCVRPEPDLD